MSDNSAIEWTDATWNPVVGCSPVSEGCRNCYAATMARRLDAMGQPAYKARPDRGLQQIQREDNVGLATALQRQKAVRIAEVRGGRAVFTGDVRMIEGRLGDPLGWRKPKRIFVCSMSDLFHPKVPFEFIDQVFAVMAICPQHTFQVLTKRPERMAEYLLASGISVRIAVAARQLFGRSSLSVECPGKVERAVAAFDDSDGSLPNVWLGTSCEDQAAANERIPELLKCPAAVRFLSCEPLLGPVDLRTALCNLKEFSIALGEAHAMGYVSIDEAEAALQRHRSERGQRAMVDWVIVGGESGPGARPCNVNWIRGIAETCREAGVPVFVKQLGSFPVIGRDGTSGLTFGQLDARDRGIGDSLVAVRVADRKGGDPSEWPEDLRVRQMPGGAA